MYERGTGEAEILDVGDDRRAWQRPSGRRTLVLALLVVGGLVVGGGAMFWWQGRADDRALANEASLIGRGHVPTEPMSLDLCATVPIRLTNTGRRPIRIEKVDIDLSRTRQTPSCEGPVSKPTSLQPLASTTWTIPVQLDCERVEGEQIFRATVRTQSGSVRVVEGQIESYLPLTEDCQGIHVIWSITGSERIDQNGKPVLRLTGKLEAANQEVRLDKVLVPEASPFHVDPGPLPDRIGPREQTLTLDVSIRDCAGADQFDEEDFGLVFTTDAGIIDGTTLDGYAPAVTAKLIRLVHASCGGAR